jgi:2-oxoglutarate dehydrogenase E2 component (dihydrolipoamide succinyltransferase)
MITEFKMPKMGESISEATIISWLKNVGDFVEAEETILEVATDKVDSDVPASVSGVITEIRFQKDDVVEVGTVLALIDSDGKTETRSKKQEVIEKSSVIPSAVEVPKSIKQNSQLATRNSDTFISPLIISIAQKENLSIEELQTIPGSGAEGRLQKSDVFNYLKNRKYPLQSNPKLETRNSQPSSYPKPKINFVEGKDRIVEMDRMRKMITWCILSKHRLT